MRYFIVTALRWRKRVDMPSPLEQLQSVWKAVNVVSSVRDLAVDSKTYQWDVNPPFTFFIDVEYSDVIIKYHDSPVVQVVSELQAGFGWQVATEQDEAGIYIVAKRKPLIGTMGRGKFSITIPQQAHISLKLEKCQLTFAEVSAQLDFSPKQLVRDP